MDSRRFYIGLNDGEEAEVARWHGIVHPHPTLKVTLHVRDTHKSLVSGTLRWVPPTILEGALIRALAPYAKEGSVTLGRSRKDERDSIPFRLEKVEGGPVPHFLRLQIGDAFHLVKVHIPGRVSACSVCFQTGHPFFQCPNRTRQPRTAPSSSTTAPAPSHRPSYASAAAAVASPGSQDQGWNKVVGGKGKSKRVAPAAREEDDITFVGVRRTSLEASDPLSPPPASDTSSPPTTTKDKSPTTKDRSPPTRKFKTPTIPAQLEKLVRPGHRQTRPDTTPTTDTTTTPKTAPSPTTRRPHSTPLKKPQPAPAPIPLERVPSPSPEGRSRNKKKSPRMALHPSPPSPFKTSKATPRSPRQQTPTPRRSSSTDPRPGRTPSQKRKTPPTQHLDSDRSHPTPPRPSDRPHDRHSLA